MSLCDGLVVFSIIHDLEPFFHRVADPGPGILWNIYIFFYYSLRFGAKSGFLGSAVHEIDEDR